MTPPHAPPSLPAAGGAGRRPAPPGCFPPAVKSPLLGSSCHYTDAPGSVAAPPLGWERELSRCPGARTPGSTLLPPRSGSRSPAPIQEPGCLGSSFSPCPPRPRRPEFLSASPDLRTPGIISACVWEGTGRAEGNPGLRGPAWGLSFYSRELSGGCALSRGPDAWVQLPCPPICPDLGHLSSVCSLSCLSPVG